MTREHQFPAAIDSLFMEGADSSHYYLNRSPKRFLEKEPTIKDVCNVCNNEALGQLDAYALTFLRDNCMRLFSRKGETNSISLDYNLLLRWVLKVSFNSARVHQTVPDNDILASYRSYMIGRAKCPNRIFLFIRGIFSHQVSDEEITFVRGEAIDDNNIIHPNYFRNSIMRFTTGIKIPYAARAVIFQAFQFSILALPKKAPFKALEELKSDFRRIAPDAYEITPQKKVYTISAGLSAFDAIKGHFLLREDDYGDDYFQFRLSQLQTPK